MSVLDINIQIIGGSSAKVNTVSAPHRLQASILPLCEGSKVKNKYVCICCMITDIITQVNRVVFQKIIKINYNYYLFEYQKNTINFS